MTRAIKRGFDPNHHPLTLRDEFLHDFDRPRCPKKQTDEARIEIIAKVRRNRFGREKTCADIAGELSSNRVEISAVTAWIECIPGHIEKIIELEGGNEYKEGRTDR
ncbi:hypothetical protein AUP68_18098 [Ilyonectria robusta]